LALAKGSLDKRSPELPSSKVEEKCFSPVLFKSGRLKFLDLFSAGCDEDGWALFLQELAIYYVDAMAMPRVP